MNNLTDLEYLRLNKFQKLLYNFCHFFTAIPHKIVSLFCRIGRFFKKIGIAVANFFKLIGSTFVHGDWKTKVSYFILGFGNLFRGQILRGLLFLIFEVGFIFYMIFIGAPNIAKLNTLGTVVTTETIVETYIPGIGYESHTQTVYGDNSFNILLFGILSLFFIVAFIYTWYVNIKQNIIAEEILKTGKPLKSGKQDIQSLVDDQFHKSLLALPTVGILIFTVLPTFFMILIAFTNYSGPNNMPPQGLFTWVGFQNFGTLLSWKGGGNNFSMTFGNVLLWTLVWAFFATFSNYFLGMLVALAINKKGIKGKKIFRGILVLTIAIPQFISLLYVSKMFSADGLINRTLLKLGWIAQRLPFFEDPTWARITVILINIWIGIPYLMLMISGVLMNIPADLYESAKIDGASPWKQYTKITLPYTLFVTGPYLLTSFTGNMNNFNVIYLLTGGGPFTNADMASSKAGTTDLLVTWLFKLTIEQQSFQLAAVIGILVFVVVSVISLVVYNVIPSVKNEEDFQ